MQFEYLFFAVFAVFILEMILSSSWNHFYFKSGLTIFKKEIYSENNITEDIILIDELENEFSNSIGPSIRFKKITEREIGFREQIIQFTLLSYTPIMHGRIIIDDSLRHFKIKGQTNWFVLLFPFVFFSFTEPYESFKDFILQDSFFLITFFAVFIIFYIIQAIRFNKVTRLVKEMINTG